MSETEEEDCEEDATISSMMLSNLRSISNKVDEVESRIRDAKPEMAVFTESWLRSDVSYSALPIEG